MILLFILGEQRLCHSLFFDSHTSVPPNNTSHPIFLEFFFLFWFLPIKWNIFLLRCSAILWLWQLSTHNSWAIWMRPTSLRSCHLRHFARVLKFIGAKICALNKFYLTQTIQSKQRNRQIGAGLRIGPGRDLPSTSNNEIHVLIIHRDELR